MRKFCILFLPALATMAQDWTVMGQGSVRQVGSTVTFTYPLQPKQLALIARPAPPEMAQLARLRFRIKTDHDTAMAVLLSEKKAGGGNYTAIVWAPAAAWQQVELTPADFSVSDGPNDPVDADGKLDLDAVEGVGIADLAQFFLSLPENPDFPIVIDRQTGEHRVEIDHFELLTTAAPSKRAGIDEFDRGFLEWFTFGGIRMKLAAPENPLKMPALEARYDQGQDTYPVLLRRLASFDLSKAKRLAFDIASEREVTMIVSLETKSGQRFTITILPPGKREVFHVSLSLADFKGAGKLDPSQLKAIALADVTSSGEPNTIWLGKVETQ
jgi:hypothetical protein